MSWLISWWFHLTWSLFTEMTPREVAAAAIRASATERSSLPTGHSNASSTG